MRLYLLPISTRRTLLYCKRLNVTTAEQKGWLEKGTQKAANLWADWEKKESGWQKKVVDYGSQAMQRIPYEEWGLKSIPPLSARRKVEDMAHPGTVEVSFPGTMISKENVLNILRTLGTERAGLHKQRLIYSIVGMPIVAPFAIVPIIPNLPFFYLVFRAWSHWRALNGGKHIEFLLDKKLINVQPSPILDKLYSTGMYPFDASVPRKAADLTEESMVLHKSDGRRIAEALELPELSLELDRAVWQVEKSLQAAKELKEEKKELDSLDKEAQKKK